MYVSPSPLAPSQPVGLRLYVLRCGTYYLADDAAAAAVCVVFASSRSSLCPSTHTHSPSSSRTMSNLMRPSTTYTHICCRMCIHMYAFRRSRMSRACALTTRQPNSTAELIFIYTCVWDAKTTHVCSVCECANVLQYNIIVFIYLYMKPINMYATQRRVSPGARLCVSSGGGCVRDAGRAAEQAKAPASTSLPTTTRVSIRTNCNENPTSIFMQAGTGKSVRACEVYICVSVYLPPPTLPGHPSFIASG